MRFTKINQLTGASFTWDRAERGARTVESTEPDGYGLPMSEFEAAVFRVLLDSRCNEGLSASGIKVSAHPLAPLYLLKA